MIIEDSIRLIISAVGLIYEVTTFKPMDKWLCYKNRIKSKNALSLHSIANYDEMPMNIVRQNIKG